MKGLKRILVLIICVVLTAGVVVLFAACGNKNHSDTPATSTESIDISINTSVPEDQTVAATDAEPNEQTDFEETTPIDVKSLDSESSTPEERYKINIFLSNFSEQWFNEFSSDAVDPDQMIGFALMWYNLNARDSAEFSGDLMMLSFEQINKRLERYFGITLSDESFKLSCYDIRNNKVVSPFGDGESYPDFTVANEIADLGNGTYLVKFKIYSLKEAMSGGNRVADKKWYYLSEDEAIDHPDLEYNESGYAIVKPYQNGNVDSYQLVSYFPNSQDCNCGENDKESSATYQEGITIFVGDEVSQNISDYFGYSYDTLTDEKTINYAREQINRVLSKYPEGFWDELLLKENRSRRSLIISLVGRIYSDDQIYSNPTGFQAGNDDTYFVFVDATAAAPEGANIEGCIFHELMHVIDIYLLEMEELYPDWDSYLPDGFEYIGHGVAYPEKLFSMCFLHTEKDEDVWFAGIYDTTSILEDRAGMMSSLSYEGSAYFEKYPHLYARMEYMKYILYCNFESIRNCNYDWLA